MRTVLVYRSVLLPYSETFIKEQVLAYRRWRGLLVGRRLWRQLSLVGLDIRLLGADEPGILARAIAKARWQIGRPPRLGLLRQESPSLLHVHFGTDAIEAEPIARFLGIPMIVTLHGYDINVHREWWESGKGGILMRQYPRRLLNLSTQPQVHFIAVSDAIKRSAIAYGIPADKLTTHYVGIDLMKFVPGPTPVTVRARRVLFVGRLVEKKGCGYLLRAMEIVKARIPDAELTVVGDGPLRSDLERLSSGLGLSTRFLGALSPTLVKAEMDTARVFCLPSVTAANGDAEGLPIAILEAQACGIPVITSARGGATESIEDGKTGLTFPEGNVATLASGIATLLQDDTFAEAFARRAPRFVAERFDIRACTEELERLYDVLAGDGSVSANLEEH
jgi:glycosyltransferase involved in cell wall biosynthesis